VRLAIKISEEGKIIGREKSVAEVERKIKEEN